MSSPDPVIPRRCTCPHFENEHDEGGPCRGSSPAMPGMSGPSTIHCPCPGFVPREEEWDLTRPAARALVGQRPDPEAISSRVMAIRDKAEGAGRIRTAAEQRAMDADRRARQHQSDEQVQARLAEVLLEGVPTRFRDAAVTNIGVRRWVDEVVSGHTTESLVLLGGVGTGKTSEAFAAWRAVVTGTKRPGQWVTVPDLLEGMRPGRPERVDFTTLQRCPLLLVDDLAAERESEWTTEVLYRLLDYRYAWCLPTVITSNVPPAEVRAKLGDRIASRLNGMGRTVTLDGPDRRTPRR